MPRGLIALSGAVFFAAMFGAHHTAAGDTSILEYDSQGRLQQLRDVTTQSGGAAGQGTAGAQEDGGNASGAGFNPALWYEPGEVVVANAPEDFEFTASLSGFRTLEKLEFKALRINLLRLATPASMTVPDAVALLSSRYPGVLIDANHQFRLQRGDAGESEARAAIGWTDIDPACGAGLRIGMIDTPVDVTHAALAGQKVTYKSFILPKRVPAPGDHGTAIAAMLVGKPDSQGFGGLLPAAELLAGNIFTYNDTGGEAADVVAMLKALDWLSAEKVQVVNLSMAGSDNRIMHHAITQAAARGMILVAAVGNWGTEDTPAYPAAYDESIGVTAVDSQSSIYSYANRGVYVAFAAPGVQIWTAVPGGGKFQSGTSFAAPYLTAKIASEIAASPGASAEYFREFLSRDAVDLGVPGKDKVFGWGLVKQPPRCAPGDSAKKP